MLARDTHTHTHTHRATVLQVVFAAAEITLLSCTAVIKSFLFNWNWIEPLSKHFSDYNTVLEALLNSSRLSLPAPISGSRKLSVPLRCANGCLASTLHHFTSTPPSRREKDSLEQKRRERERQREREREGGTDGSLACILATLHSSLYGLSSQEHVSECRQIMF